MRILLPTLVALAAAAAPAQAATLHGSSGAVDATVTYTKVKAYDFRDLHITVTRGGAPAFDAPVALEDCPDGTACRPTEVTVMDVDGDGEPEVLVDVFTGGAHCCAQTELLSWDGAAYRPLGHDWGDAGYSLSDLDGNGTQEFFTADDRFAYEFAAYAFSALPVQLLHFTGGAFTDVTSHFRKVVRADARTQMHEYRKLRRGRYSLGVAAAWAADEYRLGHRASARRFLRSELKAGRLRGVSGWPRGAKFIRVLDRRLTHWGY